MIKVENYPNAYKEVYEILLHVSKDDLTKIPKTFMDMIKNNMNDEYEFYINENIDFEEQSILKETKVILAYIFLNYWGTDEQKTRIMKKFNQDIINIENSKPQYNPQELFKDNSVNKLSQAEVSLVKYKPQNILVKILNMIRRVFKIKK